MAESPSPSPSPAASDPSFDAPGPGSWTLDGSHSLRPQSRYLAGWFTDACTRGFRAGFERAGVLLDTLELRTVEGYTYVAARPLGAPPDARSTPPKLLFKLLLRLHPALRRRLQRASSVLAEKPWREDARLEADRRATDEEKLLALQKEDLETLDAERLLAHIAELRAEVEHGMYEHFRVTPSAMFPVGDFLAHAISWTGCSREEALAALRGWSPTSLDGIAELDALAEALRGDPEAMALLDESRPASAILEDLVAREGSVGERVERWLERIGQRLATGHDVAELRLIELPENLIGALRARLRRERPADARPEAETAARSLRERVPPGDRPLFDELLEEARTFYSLRDARGMNDFWRLGLLRRGLLEAGRRLAASGALHRSEHVFHLTHDELSALLRGTGGPTSEVVAEHAERHRFLTGADVPARLGPPPPAPPPAEWLPEAAARVARAIDVYMAMVFENDDSGGVEEAAVRGTPAAPGRRKGTARLVRSAEDFAKVREGDILVAPITTPAFNAVLPLIGGLVTDRGGLLSHPAIVAREFGIPGIVGAREATRSIPDGALVEIDGDAGCVRILS